MLIAAPLLVSSVQLMALNNSFKTDLDDDWISMQTTTNPFATTTVKNRRVATGGGEKEPAEASFGRFDCVYGTSIRTSR